MATADNLPRISDMETVKVFKRLGWTLERESHGHIIMGQPDNPMKACIPKHKEIKKGIVKKLIRLSKVSVKDFIALI